MMRSFGWSMGSGNQSATRYVMNRRAKLRTLRSSSRGRLEGLEDRIAFYSDPLGGWEYEYSGDQAQASSGTFTSLDGTWDHNNGSDQWDGSAIGSGAPGGVTGGLADGTTTYARFQDTGDPSSFGVPDPSNRKLYFLHDITADGAPANVLDQGVTLSFRARISSGGILDDLRPAGGGSTSAWPSGNGYGIHDGGKGLFSIRQQNGGIISFGLVGPTEDNSTFTGPGLAMNSLNGNVASAAVDWQENEGTKNLYSVADPTAWQEYWVTIQAGGTGTHLVSVYSNESTTPSQFHVTAGTGNDGSGIGYLGLGLGSTPQHGAIDVDFLAWKPGIHAPIPLANVVVPQLTNSAATNVQGFTASIGGTVVNTGGQDPNVTIYWGNEDGGTNPAAWDSSIALGPQSGQFVANLTGLAKSTPYFYRAFATNIAGSAWAPSTATFTTRNVTTPVVTTISATNITGVSATIGGRVASTGGDPPLVTMYWGDNDAGTTAANWDNAVPMAVQSAGFNLDLTNLNPNTRYYYRASARNFAGTTWSISGGSFSTLVINPPAIQTLPPVSVGPFSALLAGEVVSDGGAPTSVTLYWGSSDGVDNPNNWEHAIDLGQRNGIFTHVLSGLATDATYYYRVSGQNFIGTTWAGATKSFRTGSSPPLLITELNASNRGGLVTRTRPNTSAAYSGDPLTPDWLELHNPGDSPINLGGKYLTDDATVPTKWRIPDGTSIAPGGFLVIYASGLDVTNPQLDETGRLHTNFELRAAGDYLAIVDEGGNVIHAYAPAFPPQRPNVSYGIDGLKTEGYYTTPTPGAPNGLGTDFVGDTRFSVDRGFFDSPFQTSITTDTLGATIIYTTDGSEPSFTNGTQVVAPNGETAPMATVNIAGTTTLRAAAFKEGFAPSDIDTHTYLFLDQVARQSNSIPGFPTTWGGGSASNSLVPADYEMDPTVTQSPLYASQMVPALQSLPSLSLVMDIDDWFSSATGIYPNSQREGIAWERAVSAELIYPDQQRAGFQIDAGIRIQGGTSTDNWKSPKLSMRLLFKDEYGAGKLDYPLFADSDVESFNTLVLDARLNQTWIHPTDTAQRRRADYVRDQFMNDLQNNMGWLSSHGAYANLYINGVYWGMYDMHERPDDAMLASHLGGQREDYDVIRHTGTNVVAGTNTSYVEMYTFARGGLADNARYEQMKARLDIPQFIDYMLLNFYGGNTDWAHQNYYAARNRTLGTPWRFYSWDAEHVLKELNENVTTKNDSGGPTELFTLLRQNANFRAEVADRIQKLFFNDGVLTPSKAAETYLKRIDEIDPAIILESARWGDYRESVAGQTYTRDNQWLTEQNFLRNTYFPQRTNIVLGQLRTLGLYPNVAAPQYHVNGTIQYGGEVDAGDRVALRTGTALTNVDTTFVGGSAVVSAFVPTNSTLESGTGPYWYQTEFTPTNWINGNNGVGFAGDTAAYLPLIGTNVGSAWSANPSSIYTRFEFNIGNDVNLSGLDRLTLRMQYDDAFVAYLNGQKIVSDQSPQITQWSSSATAPHDGTQVVTIDITDQIGLLRSGMNLLAIHGLNHDQADGRDILVRAELIGTRVQETNAIPVYYTLDGTDPRNSDGTPRGTRYTVPLTFAQTTTVKSRSLQGTTWSALSETTFFVVPDDNPVVISEINYNPHDPTAAELLSLPAADNDDFEFLELYNRSATQTVNLLGYRFTNGITFNFPNLSLAPLDRVVVARNEAAFRARYGASVRLAGVWTGNLNNGGEQITLNDALGRGIADFSYRDGNPWSERADGLGSSLELVDPANVLDLDQWNSWRASVAMGGSPGVNGASAVGLVLNEVLSNSGAGRVDAVEIFNPTGGAISTLGFYLSDAGRSPLKYHIPDGVVIPPGGRLVIDETSFNPTPNSPGPNHFSLSGNEGDDVYLSQSLDGMAVTRWIDDVHFSASPEGITWGRTPDGTGRFVPQGLTTLGCENSHAQRGTWVITEVNYNPGEPSPLALAADPSITEDDLEYIEIQNNSISAANLVDLRLGGGVDIDWDTSRVVMPGATLVIVSFDPEDADNAARTSAFRAQYGLTPAVTLVGGWQGQLSDSGERITLYRLGEEITSNGQTLRPSYLEDEVVYDDRGAWPDGADGAGASLKRTGATTHGNLPESWHTGVPDPSVVSFVTLPGDFDGDGVVNVDDIDLLSQAIRTSSQHSAFSVNGDPEVDNDDLVYLIDEIMRGLSGDATGDGRVDSLDYNAWATYRFSSCGTTWRQGDFNADGVTDASDFNIWNSNRFEVGGAARASGMRTPRAAGQVKAIDTHSMLAPTIGGKRMAPSMERRAGIRRGELDVAIDSSRQRSAPLGWNSSAGAAGRAVNWHPLRTVTRRVEQTDSDLRLNDKRTLLDLDALFASDNF